MLTMLKTLRLTKNLLVKSPVAKGVSEEEMRGSAEALPRCFFCKYSRIQVA